MRVDTPHEERPNSAPSKVTQVSSQNDGGEASDQAMCTKEEKVRIQSLVPADDLDRLAIVD